MLHPKPDGDGFHWWPCRNVSGQQLPPFSCAYPEGVLEDGTVLLGLPPVNGTTLCCFTGSQPLPDGSEGVCLFDTPAFVQAPVGHADGPRLGTVMGQPYVSDLYRGLFTLGHQPIPGTVIGDGFVVCLVIRERCV